MKNFILSFIHDFCNLFKKNKVNSGFTMYDLDALLVDVSESDLTCSFSTGPIDPSDDYSNPSTYVPSDDPDLPF